MAFDSCMRFAIRQTRAGRTPQGCPRKKDVLAPRWVGPTRLADFDPEQFVSRNTPIPEAVSFRMDVPAFLVTLNDRQRKMSLDLAGGMTTSECAAKYGVTAGRYRNGEENSKQLFDTFFAE